MLMPQETAENGHRYHYERGQVWVDAQDFDEERQHREPEKHDAAIDKIDPQILAEIIAPGLEHKKLVGQVGESDGQNIAEHCRNHVGAADSTGKEPGERNVHCIAEGRVDTTGQQVLSKLAVSGFVQNHHSIKVDPLLLDHQPFLEDAGMDGPDIFAKDAEEDELHRGEEKQADYEGRETHVK